MGLKVGCDWSAKIILCSDWLIFPRWDVYLEMADTQIHWFSIVNSIVVVFFLSGIITMIIIRTLRKDIAKYNMADDDAEVSCLTTVF